MSLKAALNGGPGEPVSTSRIAFPETVKGQLPQEEYDALLLLLSDPRWTPPAIANLLAVHHGITVGVTTIRDYRRRAATKAAAEGKGVA